MLNFIKKLQKQPEHIRKIILWSTAILIGILLSIFWIRSVSQKIKEFPKEKFIEDLGTPSLKEELKEMPKIEMPEISEEEIQELEKAIKEAREKQVDNQEQ